MKKWITFENPHPSASGKTQIWDVCSVPAAKKIGEVRWFSHWRRYNFFPDASTTYDSNCLLQIGAFCGRKTQEHKDKMTPPEAVRVARARARDFT